MNRLYNAKSEKQTIYEIFRACRLCGAGGGYKMPIIQNVVDLDTEVELRQKIKECVQIEVDAEDKMPPLICEICIEKVNDFYEFLEMCQLTNKHTRQRLGLPPQTARGVAEQEHCILGVTEPVFASNDSEDEPLLGPGRKCCVAKKPIKSETEKILIVKLEKPPATALRGKERKPLSRKGRVPSPSPPPPIRVRDSKAQSRNARVPSPSPPTSPIRVLTRKGRLASPAPSLSPSRQPPQSPVRGRDGKPPARRGRVPTPSPPRSLRRPGPASRKVRVPSPSPPPGPKRVTRNMPQEERPSRTSRTDSGISRSRMPEPTKAHKGILKKEPWPKEKDVKPEEPPRASKKRPAEKESRPSPVLVKKVKVSPPARKAAPPKPPPPIECQVCRVQLKNAGALTNHLRSHHVSFTNPKLACNACGEWFDSPDETLAHHKVHRAAHTPYRCQHCLDSFSGYSTFNEHHESNACGRFFEFPDVTCAACQRSFPTWTLRDRHRCPGQDGRPGGKCSKCKRNYALLKNLTKHEATCTSKRRGELIIDPEVMKEIRPTQIVVERCDALLTRVKGGHVDVSRVSPSFGLDRRREYPYFNTSLRVKTDPDRMVNITDEVLDYVHWDSDYTSDGETTSLDSVKPRQVDSLTTLTLKVIYSSKFLGKLPRRRRKKIKVEAVKSEVDVFDSMLNVEESFSKDIEGIMKTLDADWDDDSDAGDRSILSGIMDISLPDLASRGRLEYAMVKAGEYGQNHSRRADVESEFDKRFGAEIKSEAVNKDVADTSETGNRENKVAEDTEEKTDSTNENSVKNSEVDIVTKDNNDTTQKMDIDDESVEPAAELKDSTEEMSANSKDTTEEQTCINVANTNNGYVSMDGAKSRDDLLKGDLPESVSIIEDLPKAVSDLKDAAKADSKLPEIGIVNYNLLNEVVNKSDVKKSDKDIDTILEDNAEEDKLLPYSKGTDNLTNSKEENSQENDYAESQTFTENFEDYFKNDTVKPGDGEHANSDIQRHDPTIVELNSSINNDLGSNISAEPPNTLADNSKATEHQNNIINEIPTRSEPKCDDFSIENILKPNEEVNINRLSSRLENKITVTNGGNPSNISINNTEMEDKELMDNLDTQIGETEDQINGKSVQPSERVNHVSQDTDVNKDTAMDLENISDEELNFDQ